MKAIKKLKEKRGLIFMDTIVFVLISAIIFVLCLAIGSVLLNKYNLNQFTDEVARSVEIAGSTDDSTVQNRIKDLQDEYKIKPQIQYSRTGRLPLNTSFKVTCSLNAKFDIGAFYFVLIPLTSISSGASEVYWK